ncbi:M48 family metallopeptidase [Halorientalis sp.]|jgi:heat shock protein HtpX|uniref:M48 family metallopeptidase n=1 Tax=Halorientalis sp. TaxID=1931229 RepID=UPI002636187D|nr:M48 family metalloprotease [Halorientalis sp.]
MWGRLSSYPGRVRRRVSEIEHWELLTLMIVATACVGVLYVTIAYYAYPLFTFLEFRTYLLVAVGGVVVLAFGSVKRSVRKLRSECDPLARDEAPGIYQMLESMCADLEMPVPDVYVIPDEEVNAFAKGTRSDGMVVVHTGLLDEMNDEELRAVLGHELTHLYYRDSVTMEAMDYAIKPFRWVGMAGGLIVSLVPMFLPFALMSYIFSANQTGQTGRRNPLVLSCQRAVAFVPLAFRNALSRHREFVADRRAVDLTGNPEAMVGVLRKLKTAHDDAETTATNAFSPFNRVQTRFDAVFATHPNNDRRIELIESVFEDSDPSPLDEGAVLGRFTRFGLTVGPLTIVSALVLYVVEVVIANVYGMSMVEATTFLHGTVLFLYTLLWLVSLPAFCWAMLFADGGTPAYGFAVVVCMAVFVLGGWLASVVHAALLVLPALSYVALSGAASLHLRDVVAALLSGGRRGRKTQ